MFFKCSIHQGTLNLFTVCSLIRPLIFSRVKVKEADSFSCGKYFSASLLIKTNICYENCFVSIDIMWDLPILIPVGQEMPIFGRRNPLRKHPGGKVFIPTII